MKILAIETSCDETAIALLDVEGALEKPDIKVLGNTLLSQVKLHEKYGGVYPNLAKREHEKNLPILLAQTFTEAGEDPENPSIDFIAVTAGPGLEPALWTGITFAEKLGERWRKPVVPVNHMEGHVWSVLFQSDSELKLPALSLLVSGGHTELVYIKDFGRYEILGKTRDDAIGEAFDKVARMLSLPYPGGPEISRLAEEDRTNNPESTITFPRPMIHSKDLDFSFSGLKTAVLYKIKSDNKSDEEYKRNVARAFEDAAVEVVVEKTRKALIESEGKIKTIIVGGGVSANKHLSREIAKLVEESSSWQTELQLRLPSKLLSTDNAIMIGIAAFIRVSVNPEFLSNHESKITAKGNLLISSEK